MITLADIFKYDSGLTDDIQAIKATYHIRIVHLFDKLHPYGGVTIAYTPERKDSTGYPTGKFGRVSTAFCNREDRYSRAKGEQLAIDRLLSGESILVPIYSMGHPVKALKAMFYNDWML